ncbi:MAG TPA: thiol reductase thioredoxin [Bacteroidales bacterium]|nr:thiol reductase thioredoxin [Bacteroidales bacterium]
MIQNLNLMDFDDQMKHGYALVDYWAPWCQPCLDQNPMLEEIAKALSPRIKVFKVDINDNRVISNKEGVRNIPLLILYQDSKQIARFQGIQSKEIIIQSITKILHDL